MFGFILAGILASLITSCISSSKRFPNSENLNLNMQSTQNDPFIQAGYQQISQRLFTTKPISDEQIVKELAGRSIWFKSAPNERHHTYVFPQKIGVAIDWSQAFMANDHELRFQTWGLINDPDCCVPGVTCDQKNQKLNGRSITLDDTYGWDFCAGDETLLNSIRQNRGAEYRDPACDDELVKRADQASNQIRENRCELKFGTSTGAVGFRKFPNPQFNLKRWQKIGGYKVYSEKMIRQGMNNSVQPPFRVGVACAACHAGFDPLNTPANLNNPTWAQIKGEVGNQYLHISKLMASGMQKSTLEAQLFTHTRPGTVDTSAVPHDFINNPGSINAIINFPQRPLFKDTVLRWNHVDNCDVSNADSCQRVAYKNENGQNHGFKFWQRQKSEMQVPHMLKGGEDSVGYDLGIQRVYANNGLCSEQCWQNNVTNLREFDFTSRGYGEAPFDIGQCREQCAAFRANEDRTPEIISFLSAARPVELKTALQNSKVIPSSKDILTVDSSFKTFLEKKYGVGSIERGQNVFTAKCASCHSSQNKNNFSANSELTSGELIRADWMGNDRSMPVDQIGTYSCRALHSNHKRGNIWDQFSSETHKNLPGVLKDSFGQPINGGPGYYRNISLISVWAFAPFMHNNSVGPEVCGKSENADRIVPTNSTCETYFDPSALGRLQVYEKSMDELLTAPEARRKKVTLLNSAIQFPLGLNDLKIEFAKGLPLNTVANFDLKTFIYDFTVVADLLETQGPAAFQKYWQLKFVSNPQGATELASAVQTLIQDSLTATAPTLTTLKTISKYYRTCETGDDVENKGHAFGSELNPSDKNALKAFMATL